jgi:hypothetical protein
MKRTLGTVGSVAALTDGERQYIERLLALNGRGSFKAKQCYQNAQILILDDDEHRLRYCEGWLNDDIPHAWLTINGKVFDVTIEAANLNNKQNRYFGVVVNRRTVRQHLLRTKHYAAVLPEYPASGGVPPPRPGHIEWLEWKAKHWLHSGTSVKAPPHQPSRKHPQDRKFGSGRQ